MKLGFPYWARHFQISASEALPDRGRVLEFTGAGGAKPIAGRGGLDSGFRRTNGIHPRLRVSARIRFAVILLSKTMDVGRDHRA